MRRDEGIFECLLKFPLWAQMSRESDTHSDAKLSIVSVGDTCGPRKVRESLPSLGVRLAVVHTHYERSTNNQNRGREAHHRSFELMARSNIQPKGLFSTPMYKASRAKAVPMAVQSWHVSIPSTLMPFSLQIALPFATRNPSPVPPMDP